MRAALAFAACLSVAAEKSSLHHKHLSVEQLRRGTEARGHMHRAIVKSALNKSATPRVPMYSYDLAEYLGQVRDYAESGSDADSRQSWLRTPTLLLRRHYAPLHGPPTGIYRLPAPNFQRCLRYGYVAAGGPGV